MIPLKRGVLPEVVFDLGPQSSVHKLINSFGSSVLVSVLSRGLRIQPSVLEYGLCLSGVDLVHMRAAYHHVRRSFMIEASPGHDGGLPGDGTRNLSDVRH